MSLVGLVYTGTVTEPNGAGAVCVCGSVGEDGDLAETQRRFVGLFDYEHEHENAGMGARTPGEHAVGRDSVFAPVCIDSFSYGPVPQFRADIRPTTLEFKISAW